MRRKKVKIQGNTLELEMTPMIDVVFNLLIFFLCSPFKIPEGQLDAFLPKGDSTGPPAVVEKVVITLLDTGGDVPLIKIGRRALPLNSNGEPEFDDLARQLINRREKSKEISAEPLPVEIDSDRKVRYLYVIGVLNACTKAQIEDIRFTLPIGKTAEPPG